MECFYIIKLSYKIMSCTPSTSRNRRLFLECFINEMFYAIKAPDIPFIKFWEVYPHIVTRRIYKMRRRNVQYIVVTRRNSLYVPDKPPRGKGITVLETTRGG